MSEFSVVIGSGWSDKHTSKVYAIDIERDIFLVVNKYNQFEWVPINDCVLYEEDED